MIGDRVVNKLDPKNCDIAMVSQNYALYPHMSVYENMAYSLKIRWLSKDDIEVRVQKAAKILEVRRAAATHATSAVGLLTPANGDEARSCVNRRYSRSTNRSQTWIPSCAYRRAWKSKNCAVRLAPPAYMRHMTRSRP